MDKPNYEVCRYCIFWECFGDETERTPARCMRWPRKKKKRTMPIDSCPEWSGWEVV